MSRRALATLLVLTLALAGCTAREEAPKPQAAEATLAAEDTTAEASADPTPADGPATTDASANTTAEANATAPGEPEDPGNCMRGMDMPGCTKEQADAYFDRIKAEQAARGPPPDKALPVLKIDLTPTGENQLSSFAIDDGTRRLFISVFLNASGPGPYAGLGPGGSDPMQLTFTSSDSTTTITLAGAPETVGIDPARPYTKTFLAEIEMPAAEVWEIALLGHGENAGIEIAMVERFTT